MSDSPQEQKSNRLLKSSLVVSSMTMISRVFGLVRDMVIAFFFGSSAGADAFFLAFKIPNFFRRLFGEGAFSQAFIPVLNEYKTRRTPEEVRRLISRAAGSLGICLAVITVVGVLGAEWILKLFALGFVLNGETEKLALATDMLRLTFPYLMLISLTALAGGILNTYNRFAIPSFTPVLLNLSLIGCALFLRPYLAEPVTALAWAVLIAGVAQLTFQLPFLASAKLLPLPRVDFKDEGVRRILTLMLPAMFGVSVGQINLLLDTALATFLQTGSLSWLYYSDRLLELPLALFGITIATVILPNLSREHAEESGEEFSKTLEWAIRMVLIIGFPATLALIVLAEPLIATLFYQGEMTQRDVSMASLSLMAYGAGLLGHMLVKVLAPGYYAQQDTRTPVRIGVIALVSNMVLNLVLIWHLQHAGLALATSLSAFINAGLLFFGLFKAKRIQFEAGWQRFYIRLVFANLILGVFLFLLPDMTFWFGLSFWSRLAAMLGVSLAGVAVYAGALRLTGFDFRQMQR